MIPIASDSPKVGILLANTGSPDDPTPKGVRAFLRDMLTDHRLVRHVNRVVWAIVLRLFILPHRGVTSSERYRKVWTDEGSPLMVTSARLVQRIQRAFDEEGASVTVAMGMNYGNPSIAQGLAELRAAGAERVVVLPLYPQRALSTTGSTKDRVARALRKLRWNVGCQVIDNYHDHPTYVKALAASIKHAGFDPASSDRLIFSFHAVPVPDIEQGDQYELQTGATSIAVATELGLERRRWTIGYQSRFQKYCEWLTPSAVDVVARYAETGEGRVFFVCPGFSTDCLETHYDVFFEIKPVFDQRAYLTGRSGDEAAFVYVPCLGKTNAHVRVLTDVLRPYVGGER
ncbi:ferrochelatase [Berryella wangjianweii]|uniref:ferrochelatase n=1 Tax=Berryella wangjianweii TaxID=2734634 RepID=UPI0028F6CAD0|nr:ferrochelatase [Berryella wangjianweii]